MAMLAERKQKVKWCLNPRGNDWAKDENKFGQRMLEKMGWQPGMGLGAKGQGRTDFVRLQMKNDTKGLGNKEKYDEVWTRQQENFDSLLAQLNGTDKNEKFEDAISIPSLEDKSKMSRARVHYHKFTRGKDVSKYSSKDLNCIIGIGKKSAENSSSDLHQSPVNNLVTESPISMYDYFRSKSKNSKEIDNVDNLTSQSDSINNSEITDVTNELDEEENMNLYNSSKKEKKKSKRKKLNCDDLESSKTNMVEENTSDNQDDMKNELIEESTIPSKKNKKKKRKLVENNEIGEEEGEMLGIREESDIKPLEENIHNEIEDKSLKKKKKKRHKSKENDVMEN